MQKIFEHDAETLKSCEINEPFLFGTNIFGTHGRQVSQKLKKWSVKEPVRLSTSISNVSSGNFHRFTSESSSSTGSQLGSRRIKTIDDVRIRLNDEQLEELYKRMISNFNQVRIILIGELKNRFNKRLLVP